MQNLVAQSNFVEFRDSRNFMFFEEMGVGRHMASHVSQCMEKAYLCVTHMHGMCQHAWHMEKDIYMGCWSCSYKQGAARRKKKEKKKNERERKERKKGKEK